MAYRTFRNEKYYTIPENDPDAFMHTAKNVGEMFRALAEKNKAKRMAADQYNFDLGQGKFENDDKIFYQRGLDITQRARKDISTSGRLSPELNQDQVLAKQDKNKSDWQFKAFTDMNNIIDAKSKDDKYYDPDVDKKNLRTSAYGENDDVYYETRGDRLKAFNDRVLFKDPKSLRGKMYTADYVKTFGKKEQSKISSDPNFKSSTYSASPFIDAAGVPGVTIDHAKEYLGSRADGSVARWIENFVDEDMNRDVAYMRDHSDKIKNMSNEEAKFYLKAHPEENLFDKTTFADRVIKKAQGQLAEAADINRKIDYETKIDKETTGGLYNNDNIGHSYADHTDAVDPDVGGGAGVDSKVANATAPTRNHMPGGNLRIAKGAKVGQAIPITLNPSHSINIRTGKTNANVGSTQFNITGYQLSASDGSGKPIIMDADQIKKMPLYQLKKMAPTLSMALRGYSVDQGNKLGEISSRQSDLDDQKAEAIRKGDTEGLEKINDQIESLQDLRSKMNLSTSEFSNDDMISAMKQNGIKTTSIMHDLLLKPSDADIQLIDKTLTKGLNLNDRKKWSPEARTLNDIYEKRWKEAQSATSPDEDFNKAVKKSTTITTVNDQAGYDAVPAGAQYKDANGNIRTKKK